MAKSQEDIQSMIDALTPLVTLAEIQAILTEMNDSYASGLNLYKYDSALTPITIAPGSISIEHGLNIAVYDVIIWDTDTLTRYKPDYVTVDANEVTINWAGEAITNHEIYFLAKKD